MYCTNCSSVNVEGARFCSTCGKAMTTNLPTAWWHSAPQSQTVLPRTVQVPSLPHQPSHNSKHTTGLSTVIVSQGGGGHFQTINAAVSQVAPGTRILVRPGTYSEHVLVNKLLEIVADGAQEQVIVESLNTDCLILDTPQATIRGFTFRGGNEAIFNYIDDTALDVTDFPELSSVITVVQGQPLIEDCHVLSRAHIGIRLRPSPTMQEQKGSLVRVACPTIRRCKVHGGSLGISDDPTGSFSIGQVTIEDCEIAGQGIGIQVANGTMRRCRLQGRGVHATSTDYGVNFFGGLLEDCEISNWADGVTLQGNGTGVVRWCKIVHNSQYGVHAVGGHWTVEKCQIENNMVAGVKWDMMKWENNRIYVRDCKINRNRVGVEHFGDGEQVIEDCDLMGNELGSFAHPHVLKNVLRRNNREENKFVKWLYNQGSL